MAGDANTAGHVYPDQSLYPCNSVPVLVERINNALQRADQVRACCPRALQPAGLRGKLGLLPLQCGTMQVCFEPALPASCCKADVCDGVLVAFAVVTLRE